MNNIKVSLKKSNFLSIVKIAGASSIFSYITSILAFVQLGIIYRYVQNEEINGLWLTIFSVLSWIYVLDFGIGNSIRNLIQKAYMENDEIKIKKYISTGLISSSFIFFVIILILFPFIVYLDWNLIFNIQESIISGKIIKIVLFITIVFTILKVLTSLLSVIYNVTNKNHYISLMNLFANLLSVSFLSIALMTKTNSLIIVALSITVSPLLVNLTMYYINFIRIRKPLFSFSMYDKSYFSTIYGHGLLFLFLQICSIVLYTTDSIIIAHYLSPSEVSSYQYTIKIFSMITILFSAILSPFWSSVSTLNYHKNKKELNQNFKKIILILLILSICIIILSMFINDFVTIITGVENMVSSKLIFYAALFTIVQMLCSLFQATLNGLNLLKIQLLTFGVGSLVNIPLSIFFINNIANESYSVLLASIISLLPSTFILPLVIMKSLNFKKRR